MEGEGEGEGEGGGEAVGVRGRVARARAKGWPALTLSPTGSARSMVTRSCCASSSTTATRW